MHCCLDGCSYFIFPKESRKIDVYFQNRDTVNQTDWFACMLTLKYSSFSGSDLIFLKPALTLKNPKPTSHQKFWQDQGVSPGEQAKDNAAMCNWGKWYPRHKVEVCNPSLLPNTNEAIPGGLGPVLGSSVQGQHGHTGEGPAKGYNDEGMEMSLAWGKAEKAECAQAWEEKAQGMSLVYVNTKREGAKRTASDTFQGCQDQKQWAQTEMQNPLSVHQETLCYS